MRDARGEPAPDAARKPEPEAGAPGPASAGSRRILGTRVDATSYAEASDAIVALALARAGGAVCAANVHVVMEALADDAYRRAVNACERVTPDGMPLVWALRRRGIRGATRVYGPTLTQHLCARAADEGIAIGFYGSTWPVLSALVDRLTRRHPELRIAYVHSPPFRALSAEEDAQVVADIQESGVGILFVGLGCPKQERWSAAHRGELPCVLVNVGAAFDFLAGHKRQAPAWLQRAGLEWLFRLAAEPRRLWRRYLRHNPRFLYHLLKSGDGDQLDFRRRPDARGRTGGSRKSS